MTMFSKVKKAEDRATLVESLKYIVTQTLGPAGMTRAPREVADKITKYEPTFVEISGEPDAVGQVVMRATAAAIKEVTGSDAPTDKPKFELETGHELPVSKRGGGLKADIYPFAAMEKGMSFHVAASDKRPNPAKSLASTITAANRRFAAAFPAKKGKNPHPQAGQPSGQDGRKFTVRPAVATDPKGPGARVYRIA